MPFDILAYANHYPMAPLGGLFVGTVGVFIILGATLARYRMPLPWIGFACGIAALILGAPLQAGLPNPSLLQAGSLGLAITLEIIAFRFFMPRFRAAGPRTLITGSLGIVGLHFFIMLPTFGPLIGLLALLCTLNAAAAWKLDTYRSGQAWFVDGLLKIALGGWMLTTSPLMQAFLSHRAV